MTPILHFTDLLSIIVPLTLLVVLFCRLPAPVSVAAWPPGGQRARAAPEAGGDRVPRRLGRQAGGNGGGHAAGGRAKRRLRFGPFWEPSCAPQPGTWTMMSFPPLCPGVRQHHGVLPDAAAAQLGPGPVQHLPLQPVGQRAGRQGRRTSRSVGASGPLQGGRSSRHLRSRGSFSLNKSDGSEILVKARLQFSQFLLLVSLLFSQTCPPLCRPWRTPGPPVWAWCSTY